MKNSTDLKNRFLNTELKLVVLPSGVEVCNEEALFTYPMLNAADHVKLANFSELQVVELIYEKYFNYCTSEINCCLETTNYELSVADYKRMGLDIANIDKNLLDQLDIDFAIKKLDAIEF